MKSESRNAVEGGVFEFGEKPFSISFKQCF
jgi:hypothetical protein